MLKKIGTVVVATAAGVVMLGGMASASEGDCGDACRADGTIGQDGSVDQRQRRQVGLVNVNGTSVAENVNVVGAVCDNEINALGVQVSVKNVLNGAAVPVAAPGYHETVSSSPDFCAMSGNLDD